MEVVYKGDYYIEGILLKFTMIQQWKNILWNLWLKIILLCLYKIRTVVIIIIYLILIGNCIVMPHFLHLLKLKISCNICCIQWIILQQIDPTKAQLQSKNNNSSNALIIGCCDNSCRLVKNSTKYIAIWSTIILVPWFIKCTIWCICSCASCTSTCISCNLP